MPGRLVHQQRGLDQLSNELALHPFAIISEESANMFEGYTEKPGEPPGGRVPAHRKGLVDADASGGAEATDMTR